MSNAQQQQWLWFLLACSLLGCTDSAPSKGRIRPDAFKSEGTIDRARVPDVVATSAHDGTKAN